MVRRALLAHHHSIDYPERAKRVEGFDMRVLITCGPTWMPIDDVRVISNQSTGEIGHLIAQECLDRNLDVTLIEGPVTHLWPNKKVKVIRYKYFDELRRILDVQLKKKFDVIIHAAAVSDFKVEKTLKGKVSSARSLILKLIPTIKLIDQIKIKAPDIFLVGFKLESNLKPHQVVKETKALFGKARCDLVVANSLENGYQGFIVEKQGKILAKANNKKRLAEALVKKIM